LRVGRVEQQNVRDDDGVVHVGRRVGAWVVAAAVTVALVTGGVLVARGGGGRSPAVLPALDLDAAGTAAGGQAAAGSGAATEPAPAPGKVAPARPPEPGDPVRPWWPVTYRLAGPLPALPDRARAWKVGDGVDAGRVATLAAALGLRGQPAKVANGWTVRDGRRSLEVQRLAGVPFSYSGAGFGTCIARAGGGPYRPGGGIQCLDADALPARPLPRPAPPSRAEAERVARDLAARAGLDLAGATVKVGDGYGSRTVTIDPAVGGLPTSGLAWTVTVGAKGVVQYASGFLATPEPADTYPLIGVADGFERLKKAPWPRLLVPMDRSVASVVQGQPCPANIPTRVPCATRPLPARVVTVTGVRLGLERAPVVTRGNRPSLAYLLPAYLFDLKGGWTDVRPVVAVPDRYLTRP
jgi:hypothetical protein